MKTTSTTHLLLVLSLFAVTLSSCGAGALNKKAEITANTFYTDLQKKDYPAAIEFCSNKAFATDSKLDWTKDLEKNAILLGDLKSFTKTSGFNISTSTTTGTMVTVAFDVQWQYGKSRDSVTLIEEKDGSMKIYNYRWDHSDANYIKEIGASQKESTEYMDALKSNNYDQALNMCSDDAFKITPRDQWKSALEKASDLGPLSDYSVIKDSSVYHIGSTGSTGVGNYYDIVLKSKRGTTDLMEKIIFFQKNYNEPIKVVGHSFL